MLTLDNSPGLAEILMNDHLDGVTAEALVKWAQDALEQGHDNAPLLKLAIEEPPYFTPDLRLLFQEATHEIGIEEITFDQARAFYAQSVGRRLAAASASPREIAERLARIFPPHMTPPPFDIWWKLDDSIDCDHCLEGMTQAGKVLDQVIADELANLLRFDWRAARHPDD